MKKEPKIKIFVVHHKPGYIYEDDVYVPIQVGKKNAKIDLGIIGDDTGDNISEKNDNYAELTAQYWVWKNYDLSDVDYVGFCHYRRYMTYCYKINIFSHIFAKNFYSKTEGKYLLNRRIKSILEHNHISRFDKNKLKKNSDNLKQYITNNQFDIYTPKKEIFLGGYLPNKLGITNVSCASFGNTCGFVSEKEIKKLNNELIRKKCSDRKDAEYKVREESKKYRMLHRHIFIMKKELYFQYMEWLFDYLFELETLMNQNNLDNRVYILGDFYGRLLAFFSEPLINYWIEYMKGKHNIKVENKSNILMYTD